MYMEGGLIIRLEKQQAIIIEELVIHRRSRQCHLDTMNSELIIIVSH